MTNRSAPGETHEPLVTECEFPDAPEKVWRALTDPELLARWLMPNTFNAVEGRDFAFAGAEARLSERVECTVIEVSRPWRLRLSWRETDIGGSPASPETEVTFELVRTESGGTRFKVSHSGLGRTQAAMHAANADLRTTSRLAA